MSSAALVTGASGFVGSHLARRLTDSGWPVVAIERDEPRLSGLDTQAIRDRISIVRGDVCDLQLVSRVLGEYSVTRVFHLAAQALVGVANRSPLPTFEANVAGTWTVLEACRLAGAIEAVVVASSDKAYGGQESLPYREDETPLAPKYPYDVSKACADLIARCYAETFGMPVVVTRCANIYGPGDHNVSRLVPEVCLAVARGTAPVVRSDGSPERDYLYIDDAVRAYLLLGDHARDDGVRGEAFNVGNGRPVSVIELVRTALAVGGHAGIEPRVLGTATHEIDRQYLDPSRIRDRLGFLPEWTLEAGLAETIRWYRTNAALFNGTMRGAKR